MLANLTVFVAALLAALVLTPVSRRLAARVGAIDTPGDLKVHSKPMPRFGGSAIWAAVVLACAAGGLSGALPADLRRLLVALAGATTMALLGALDDIIGLSFRLRLAVGLLATLVVSAALVWLDRGLGLPQLLLVVCSAVWLLGTSNAVNMLDGLDGLAAGCSGVMAAAIATIAMLSGDAVCALLACATVGACLGFLPYNFRPASTFMGDVGSLFLGCTLATTALLLSAPAEGRSAWPLALGAMVAVGLPVGDMVLAMARRVLNHRGVFEGDRGHFYDQLRDRFGFSVLTTVLTAYLLALVAGGLGVMVSLLPLGAALVAALVTAALTVLVAIGGGFLRREASGDPPESTG